VPLFVPKVITGALLVKFWALDKDKLSVCPEIVVAPEIVLVVVIAPVLLIPFKVETPATESVALAAVPVKLKLALLMVCAVEKVCPPALSR
jgi:hypothetical protein